jgi:hypothetical protein
MSITTLSQQKSFAQLFIKRIKAGASHLGGAISVTREEISNNVPNAFWTPITATRATSGGTRYRCFYFYNSHDSIYATNPIVYISQQTASPGDEVSIALGSSGINGTEQTIADEFTAPTGVNFIAGTTRTTGIVVNAAIPPLGWFAIWLSDTIKPNAESFAYNNYKVRIEINDPGISYIPPPINQDTAHSLICAVGDTGNNADFDNILRRMKARDSKTILTLGNNSYEQTGQTWLTRIESILTKLLAKSKVHMCFGDEDWTAHSAGGDATKMLIALINQYKNYFGYQNVYHAYTIENIRIITLNTNSIGGLNIGAGSDQYAFAQKELKAAYNDNKIDWIIVALHHPLFFAKTDTGIIPKTSFATDYHPLFETYGVHLLLFAHASLYVRFGVLQYNATTPTIPTELLSGQAPNYSFTGQGFNHGLIHIGVGTGGALNHGHSDHIISSVAYQKASVADTTGYLYIETLNNGKKLHAIWYDGNDVLRDEFSITKS